MDQLTSLHVQLHPCLLLSHSLKLPTLLSPNLNQPQQSHLSLPSFNLHPPRPILSLNLHSPLPNLPHLDPLLLQPNLPHLPSLLKSHYLILYLTHLLHPPLLHLRLTQNLILHPHQSQCLNLQMLRTSWSCQSWAMMAD